MVFYNKNLTKKIQSFENAAVFFIIVSLKFIIMFTKLFKKNDVKIIENGNHQKIMKLLQSPRNSLSEKAQLALIQ